MLMPRVSKAGNRRLPNNRELQSLVDYGQYNPAWPEGHPFTKVQCSLYWASTTNAEPTLTTGRWEIGFGDGP
jgi:hypothetical protein